MRRLRRRGAPKQAGGKRRSKVLSVAAAAFGAGLVAGALGQELRKPRREREWHGRVLRLVPYDFRPPTPARVRAAWWNRQDRRLFTDRPLGIGWSVNLARLFRRA